VGQSAVALEALGLGMRRAERAVMMRAARVIAALVLVALSQTAPAGKETLLIELDPRSSALPAGVSASGAVVVGGFDSGGGFYWMPTTGVISVGGRSSTDVSRDGRTIVGSALDSRGVQQAAIWLRASEWKLLGSFTPSAAPCDMSLSIATDVSADGKVVVGRAGDGCTVSNAFRWEESTGMVNLGSSVAGRPSLAQGVSADGRVSVGYQDRADGFRQGARWVDGRQELFQGPTGPTGTAMAANKDGSIIVGRICSPAGLPDPNDQSAWMWTASTGVRCLPAPRRRVSPGPAILVDANATSDDGRVVGGGQNVGGSRDSDAVVWIDGAPSYLKDYLQANGVQDAFATWVNTGAITGISPDGRILVGNGAAAGGFRGYIVILGDRP
jgi:probable HAF family extracellular repeat protein